MSLLLTATKLRLVDRATTHVPRPLNLPSLPYPTRAASSVPTFARLPAHWRVCPRNTHRDSALFDLQAWQQPLLFKGVVLRSQ